MCVFWSRSTPISKSLEWNKRKKHTNWGKKELWLQSTEAHANHHSALFFHIAKKQFSGRKHSNSGILAIVEGNFPLDLEIQGKHKLLRQYLHGRACAHTCAKIAWQHLGRIPTFRALQRDLAYSFYHTGTKAAQDRIRDQQLLKKASSCKSIKFDFPVSVWVLLQIKSFSHFAEDLNHPLLILTEKNRKYLYEGGITCYLLNHILLFHYNTGTALFFKLLNDQKAILQVFTY